MHSVDSREALRRSVEEVLETMFFTTVTDPSDQEAEALAEPGVAARLVFEGNPSGWLAVELSDPAARSIAADFLGEEESSLSAGQIEEVVCELANMICGAVLSRVESETTFRLDSPETVPASAFGALEASAAGCPDEAGESATTTVHVHIGSGPLRVALYTGTAICPWAAKSAS